MRRSVSTVCPTRALSALEKAMEATRASPEPTVYRRAREFLIRKRGIKNNALVYASNKCPSSSKKCALSSRNMKPMHRNWSRTRERERVRRQGSEDARGDPPFMYPLLSRQAVRPRIPKANLRALADAALKEWKARHGGDM